MKKNRSEKKNHEIINSPVTTWFKDGYFWRHPDPKWAVEARGADTESKGDIIYNTMSRIIDQEDKSDWAFESLLHCTLLLIDWRRWPIRCDQSIDARTAVGWRLNQLARWLYLTGKIKYRWRHSITRDPFIATYCCALFLGLTYPLETTPMPLWIYSPRVWRWKRRLLKDKRKLYVQRLDHYMSMATWIRTFDNEDIQQNIEDAKQ